MTSRNRDNILGRLECLGRGLVFSTLAALPFCGLILFFEITRPAHLLNNGFVSTELSSADSLDSGIAPLPLRKHAIARLRGVSAELREGGLSGSQGKIFSASDAELAFASAPKIGFRTEFVTKQHRRVVIRIIRREPITDRPMPDNSRLMDVVPASTAHTVTFAWGSWLYVAEVEDKGVEPKVVVQEVL